MPINPKILRMMGVNIRKVIRGNRQFIVTLPRHAVVGILTEYNGQYWAELEIEDDYLVLKSVKMLGLIEEASGTEED